MEEFILNLTNGALDNLNYGWIILFMAIESSFIPFPSEVVMIPAAYMAAETGEMSFPMIIICGSVGALIGALVNYILARSLGWGRIHPGLAFWQRQLSFHCRPGYRFPNPGRLSLR